MSRAYPSSRLRMVNAAPFSKSEVVPITCRCFAVPLPKSTVRTAPTITSFTMNPHAAEETVMEEELRRQASHLREIRARLIRPPNAVPDLGIDLKRRRLPPQVKKVAPPPPPEPTPPNPALEWLNSRK